MWSTRRVYRYISWPCLRAFIIYWKPAYYPAMHTYLLPTTRVNVQIIVLRSIRDFCKIIAIIIIHEDWFLLFSVWYFVLFLALLIK